MNISKGGQTVKRNETYYLSEETIKLVKDFANQHFGNKSKVVEAAIKDYISNRQAKKEI